jgi:hypothetical protein
MQPKITSSSGLDFKKATLTSPKVQYFPHLDNETGSAELLLCVSAFAKDKHNTTHEATPE